MFVPDSFKTTIANYFYDKTIYILTDTSITDSEGDVTRTISSSSSSFSGNVNFRNLQAIQEEMGISEKVDIYITTSLNTTINNNDFISYNNVKYKVTSVVPYDSHLGITGTIWQ